MWECGSEEKRAIWNRLDVLGKLTVRMLLRFGTTWTNVVDFTREFFCDKTDRFPDVKLDLITEFEPLKTKQYRSMLDWFLVQGPGLDGLKVSMAKFVSMLGQAYGVFSLVQPAR